MSGIESRFVDYKYEKLFDVSFVDSQGIPFNAKPDAVFLDTRDNSCVYVELKEGKLNGCTSTENSRKALLRQCDYRRIPVNPTACYESLSASLWLTGHYYDCLKYGWNHSVYKHAAVAKELAKHNMRYMLVFSTHPPTVGANDKPFKIHYQSKGIREVLLEPELKALIDSGVFVKAAIH